MNTGQLATILVSVMVCGVLIAGMLPLFGDVSASEDTLTNDGYFRMEKYGTDSPVTIVWDHTKPSIITINDEDISLSNMFPLNMWVNLAVGDLSFLRYADGGTVKYIQFYYGSSTGQRFMLNSGSTDDITIVCENGTATGTVYYGESETTATQTTTYTDLYVISDKGAYTMKKSNEGVYMASDSPLFAFGTSDIGGATAFLKITGNIGDGIDITITGASAVCSIVDSSETIDATELSNYVGYELNKITFKIEKSGTEYDITYSYFIVPYEVTLERSAHMSDVMSTIIQLVPLLAVVGLVLATIGYVLYKRL